MKRAKKLLSLFLTCAMMLSTVAFVATASAGAAETETETTAASTVKSASDFSWDNASVYFLLTDRFYNGNTSNDHSYNRSLSQDGKTVVKGNSNAATFHGGDFAGITKKIKEGYFTDLGVNALWISAPYEQIHGYCMAGNGKSGSYQHYSYHGYYALDYTQTDANFGTAEEFEEMVDTAHENGIRIVIDIVMNHAGYNTLYDMNEYGFGVVKSGWETNYFNCKLTDQTYHQYIDYNTGTDKWLKWWGGNWLRAGLPGYQGGGGDDLTMELSFLPDFRTESTTTVDIPEVLKTKWTKEGTYAAKKAEQDKYFSSTGKQKTVRNYLVYWLSQWVEKYGVDGFRCDTAKHVELASWNALKTEASSALEKWRANNPTKPGADWDESFWMTGECFPHGVNYDSYYTQGGFDSMINFEFGNTTAANASGSGVPGVSSINNTYSSYAQKINTNDKFNVLTYISSHDTWLARNCDLIYQGSAFQLMPGAIQIYYGDETNRPLYSDGNVSMGDHALRGDMNWSDIQNSSSSQSKILAHWQKVGTFRNSHIAVGAGSHTSLSANSGAAFARTYNKNGVTDKIVACIGANKNSSITINLNGTFADGTVLKNTYDGTTATVSGGKVTFNSGANGTILLEESGQPATTEPVTTVPVTTVPVTTAPVTTAPVTTAPVTTAPVTTVPTTTAPVTTAPVTTAPTTTAPVTTAPTTTAPVTTVPPTTAPVVKYLIGDVDLDGNVKVLDATLVQKYLASLVELSDEQRIAADCEPSGKIDVKDATIIQKYCADIATDTMVGKYMVFGDISEPTTAPSDGHTLTELTELANKLLLTGDATLNNLVMSYYDLIVGGGSQQEINNAYAALEAAYSDYLNGSQTTTAAPTTEAAETTVPTEPTTAAPTTEYIEPTTEYVEPTTPYVEPTTEYVEPTTIPSSGGVIKFTDSLNWGTVYAYFTDGTGDAGAAWPGTEMTWFEENPFGQSNYQVDVPSGAVAVIFNNGNGTQTVDLAVSGVEGYWLDGTQTEGKFNGTAWDPSAMEGGGNNGGDNNGGDNNGGGDNGGSSSSGNVIKFTDSLNWGTVYAYFHDGTGDAGAAWPGAQMTWYESNFEGKGNYQIDIPEGAVYVIFNNGNGAQTVDLTLGVEGYWLDGSQTEGKYNGNAWDPSAL